jgi:hypothetical protein
VALRTLHRIHALNLPQNRQQRAYWCEDGCGGWHLTSQPLREGIDLHDEAVASQRAELQTYESPDVARAAAMTAILVTTNGGTASLSAAAERWRHRYPRHASAEGRRSVDTRLRRGLRALEEAGIVCLDVNGGTVTVLDLDALYLVGANLPILEDSSGFARPPSKWPRNPDVPPHLKAVQASMVAAGQVGWKRIGHGKALPPPAPVIVPVRRSRWYGWLGRLFHRRR